MKTKLLVAVIATCFAAPVLAQSSITIYGIADAGLMKSSDAPLKLVSGIADGSRLGFKGVEDMGGGFKTIFNLESRIELDNGTQQPTLINDNPGFYLTRGMGAIEAGTQGQVTVKALQAALQAPGSPAVNTEKALFDRTSMVGLITPGGAILMGRMYTPGYEVFAASDVFETGTGGTWGSITGGTAGFTALGADIRSQKSIQYRIADPKTGLGGALMYGFKGSGYLGRYNKFWGANLVYKANGWDIGIGHNRGTDQSDHVSLVTTTLGGSYTTGDWKLFAGFHQQRNDHSVLNAVYDGAWDGLVAPGLLSGITAKLTPALGAAAAAATAKGAVANLSGIFYSNIANNLTVDARSFQFGAHLRFGSGRIMASVAHQNDRTASDSDATLVALGYDYNLSKRTDVYTVLAVIKNSNDGQYTPAAASAPGGFTKVPGDTGRAIQVGIRHRF